MGRSVAFEVDRYEPADQTGWTVVVRGQAGTLTSHARADGGREHEMAERDRTRPGSRPQGALELPGAPGIDIFHDRRWLILRPAGLSGRRLS